VLTPRPGVGARRCCRSSSTRSSEAELRAKQGKVSKDEVRELQSRSRNARQRPVFLPDQGARERAYRRVLRAVRVPRRAAVDKNGLHRARHRCRSRTIGPFGPAHAGEADRCSRCPWRRASAFPCSGSAPTPTGPRRRSWTSSRSTERTGAGTDELRFRRGPPRGHSRHDAGRNVAVAPSGEVLTAEEAARVESTTGAAAAGEAAPASGGAEKRTVPARLRTLNQLLADGLITEASTTSCARKIPGRALTCSTRCSITWRAARGIGRCVLRQSGRVEGVQPEDEDGQSSPHGVARSTTQTRLSARSPRSMRAAGGRCCHPWLSSDPGRMGVVVALRQTSSTGLSNGAFGCGWPGFARGACGQRTHGSRATRAGRPLADFAGCWFCRMTSTRLLPAGCRAPERQRRAVAPAESCARAGCYEPVVLSRRPNGCGRGPCSSTRSRSTTTGGSEIFRTSRLCCEVARPHGASFVGLNPLHALFPREPLRTSVRLQPVHAALS